MCLEGGELSLKNLQGAFQVVVFELQGGQGGLEALVTTLHRPHRSGQASELWVVLGGSWVVFRWFGWLWMVLGGFWVVFGWFLDVFWVVLGWFLGGHGCFLGGLKRIKRCGKYFWWVDGEVVFVIA